MFQAYWGRIFCQNLFFTCVNSDMFSFCKKQLLSNMNFFQIYLFVKCFDSKKSQIFRNNSRLTSNVSNHIFNMIHNSFNQIKNDLEDTRRFKMIQNIPYMKEKLSKSILKSLESAVFFLIEYIQLGSLCYQIITMLSVVDCKTLLERI